jgi:two-component system nitrogen regulation response regulator GlnG
MTHLPTRLFPQSFLPIEIASMATVPCQAMVLVVSDSPEVASVLDNICDFLGFGIELLSTEMDLAPFLERHQPMAVVAELNGAGQDGCHVMMRVADHDPGLPLLILSGHEPGMAGAIDAVEQIWSLTGIKQAPDLPDIGQLVEFLFQAGRRGNCVRMMPS